MNDRRARARARARARKALDAIAMEFAAQPQRNEAVYGCLLKLATAPEIVELVATFGTRKLPLAKSVILHALSKGYDPRAGAAKALMWIAACVVADRGRPVRARDLADARAIIGTRWTAEMPQEHIDALLAIQAPLDDPIVRHRMSVTKDFDGEQNPTSRELGRALAIRARMRDLARGLFGVNGDLVVNIFVNVLTDIPFSRDDDRPRPKR
jgi:hypothetical protein